MTQDEGEQGMFERFTDRARKVMALANQEACRFNQQYIGPEHIFLGLLREGSGVGATVLKNCNVNLLKTQIELAKSMAAGSELINTGKLPHTKEAKSVIEHAIEEARKMNHVYVGTEHLLLGIMRETEGIATQIIKKYNLTYEQVKEEIVDLLGVGEKQPSPARTFSFSDRARKIMMLANQEALRYNCESIEPEHILLAFIKEGSGVGATILKNLNVDIGKLRNDVVNNLIKNPFEVMAGKLPHSPIAKKVLEYAIECSKTLKRNYIGSEHILLGLMCEVKGNKAAEILKNCGVTEEKIKNGIVELTE
jgi:ATP-dependent Clp protease ATP-binding subunit ClpA